MQFEEPTQKCAESLLSEHWLPIAERWYRQLLATPFEPAHNGSLRQRIDDLVSSAADQFLARQLDPILAQELGSSLVDLGFRSPEALGSTQRVLGLELMAVYFSTQLESSQLRIMSLLSEIAVGFTRRFQEMTLSEATSTKVKALMSAETDRRAMRSAEARLSIAAKHTSLMLLAFDHRGIITFAEGHILSDVSDNIDEIVGRSIWEAARFVPDLPVILQRALQGETFRSRVVVKGRVVETHFVPRFEEGVFTEVFAVSIDVTEQEHAAVILRANQVGLSPAERRVLTLLAQNELTYRRIGDALCISPETVRNHMRSIGHKLGTDPHRVVVVAAAQRLGLLAPEAAK